MDHVDPHLSRRITLADMAAAAGLTRMHFAAQFRAATGMRPHDFVLQRRIERAQELLRNPELTLVDVALSVGFQIQAHSPRSSSALPARLRTVGAAWRQGTMLRNSPSRLTPGMEQGGAEMHRDG